MTENRLPPDAERDYDIIRNASPEVMADVLRMLEPDRRGCGHPRSSAERCGICADAQLAHTAATLRMFEGAR